MDRKVTFVIPCTNKEVYGEWFSQSKIEGEKICLEISDKKLIPSKLNEFLKQIKDDRWLVFCNQDTTFFQDISQKLEKKKTDSLYGIIGARLKTNSDLEPLDGRSGNFLLEDREVDSLGQCCIAIHSSTIKKHALKFDDAFFDNFMMDFSLSCKRAGIPVRVIPIRAIQNEEIFSIQLVEYYKKLFREKYHDILPVGLWGGRLSSNEVDDLKDYLKHRDDWIRILLEEKQNLNSKLHDSELMLEKLLEKSEDGEHLNNIGKEQIYLQNLYDELEKKLVWIFGTPRSGSSWLAKEMLKEKKVKFLDELLLGAQLGAFFDNPQVHWNLLIENYSADFTRILDRDREDTFFSSKYEKSWKEHLRVLILDRIYQQFGISGYDNIIVKAPNESMASDMIMKCLPKSKLIFLIRDGRDVIDSRQGKFHNPRRGTKNPETSQERKFRISHFARIWNTMINTTKNAYDHHDPKLRIMVKYEDLRLDTQNQISRIYKFLGWNFLEDKIKKIVEDTKFENIPPEDKGEDKDKRKAKPGGYKEYLSDEEIEIANKIMKTNLVRYGYDL